MNNKYAKNLCLPLVEVAWLVLSLLYFYTNPGLDVYFQESRNEKRKERCSLVKCLKHSNDHSIIKLLLHIKGLYVYGL